MACSALSRAQGKALDAHQRSSTLPQSAALLGRRADLHAGLVYGRRLIRALALDRPGQLTAELQAPRLCGGQAERLDLGQGRIRASSKSDRDGRPAPLSVMRAGLVTDENVKSIGHRI